MRVRTLEIRWHDSKPISTCDFQHIPFKRARHAQDRSYAAQAYRLATGGEDNHVRVWMVHPNILPPTVVETESTSTTDGPLAPRPPRVEYMATLSRHSAAVNVVRFSPNGEYIASAGDDGMIIIWAPSNTPHSTAYGSDLTSEELQYEKEFWKPRTTFRCTTMQVYDLAWSPTGEYLLAGSTDNTARIFSALDGKCVHEIAEHNHYVQGVAWDPLNEYIATQSSDRSMHVYSISNKQGALEVHAVGKNARMPYHHARTPSHSRQSSQSRPRLTRRPSTTSEAESVATSLSELFKDEASGSGANTQVAAGTLTPATSVASTPVVTATTMFPPPPLEKTSSSRRSSFSAPGSPAMSHHSNSGRYARSPSPMPALPAIRMPQNLSAWASVRLYGDESFSNFFRRLTFSPDGGLLLTPAGQFEDPTVMAPAPKAASSSGSNKSEEPTRGRKTSLSVNTSGENATPSSTSSVLIYSRANFARPPVAQLPGHKKASVAVRFSPILYELRQGVIGAEAAADTKCVTLEKGKEENIAVDIIGAASADAKSPELKSPSTNQSNSFFLAPVIAPAPLSASSSAAPPMLSPALSATDSLRPATPASKPATPVVPSSVTSGSVFALPYRMLFAVATMDTVAIYDTQQSGPICLLTKLHYDEFTDLTWSPDGQCLMLSARDGYCTLVVFDDILPVHHTQQSTLQLQSIAHHHSVPLTTSSGSVLTPASTPLITTTGLPVSTPTPSPAVPSKRAEPPLTPAPSDVGDGFGDPFGSASVVKAAEADKEDKEPPKKKRRVALTRVGDID